MLKSIISISLLLLLTACNEESSKPKNNPQATQNETYNQNNDNNSSLINEPLNNQDNQEEIALAQSVAISETQYFRVLSPKSCEQNEKNRFIYQVMHDSYLWANEVPELDYSSHEYNGSQKMLNALKSSKDKFSFIIDAKTAQNFFEEGKNNDLGLGLIVVKLDETNFALVVRFVYPNSPAYKQGVKRGDIIKFVENKTISKETFDDVVNILETQKTIKFSFLQDNNTVIQKSITKKSYDIQTVLYSKMLINRDKSKKVGYLVFQDFIHNANQELDNIFQIFKRNSVNELVLDLRYNGGGVINVANHLASLIGGVNSSEHIFNQIHFNETYSQFNEISYFEKAQTNALNLNRVFVITTEATCSSSELVINALKASANNIEVIQIGEKTCGKPYGYMGSGHFCDKALYAINIESKNGDGVGGYVDGLTPTCLAQDNYFKSFGDTTEDSLAEALNYITYNRCSSKSTSTKLQKATQQTSTLKLPQDGFKRIMNAY